MKPFTTALFIAVFTTASAVAQQATNPPPAEAPSPELQIDARPEEDRIQFLSDVAAAYLSENDTAAAITAYERILEIDPLDRKTRYLVSTIYIGAKQYAKAEQMLTSLIEEFPEDFQIKNNLAWLYATAEDHAFRDGQKAIELAQEAMVLAPKDHHIWSTLAEAYYAAGQYEKAYRAINHMIFLAERYRSDLTEQMIASYNKQIRKCRRALNTEQAFQDDEEETPASSLSVDEDAQ